MININLSDVEYKLILDYRQKQKEIEQKIEKRKTCKHEYKYVGHGHNDDCYECSKCGSIEWR